MTDIPETVLRRADEAHRNALHDRSLPSGSAARAFAAVILEWQREQAARRQVAEWAEKERAAFEEERNSAALIPADWVLRHGRHELVGPPGWAGPTIERDPDQHGFVWRVSCNAGWCKKRTMEEALAWLSEKIGCEVKAP